MALTPNIDARGRKVRYTMGVIECLIGLGLGAVAVIAFEQPSAWMLAAGGVVLALGAFSIFEAKKSWCAVRACGIKTRV